MTSTHLDYSQEELQEAFEIVKNPTHWKDPIDWVGDLDDELLACVRAAIPYFTATEARCVGLDDGNNVRITAEGYRAGPAGDH